MKNLLQDLRFTLRGLRKSPVFTAVAVTSLALGIGANTAIFSLINQLLLKPLPVKDPQAVVLLRGVGRHYGGNNGRNALSYPMYQQLRDKNVVFSAMMCRYSLGVTVGVQSQVEVATGELVSGNYFPMLGIGAAAGRVFSASDDLHPGAHPLAVLSYAWWKSRFAGDHSVIGQTIRINNVALTVIGIAQPGFDGMEPGLPAKIFFPMTMAAALRPGFTSMYQDRQRWVNVYGRLKPGQTLESAAAGLQPLFHQIINTEVLEPPFRNAPPYVKQQFLRMALGVIPGSQGNAELRRRYETALKVLMCVVALVLLIACANLASLLMARAAARQKEIAIRLAIGSSRGRLVQQLLTESLLLSLGGAAAGVALAVLILKALLGFLPMNSSGYNITNTPDSTVLLFTLGISVLAGIAFGLAPALQSTRPDIAPVLKDQAGSVTGGSGQISFRKVLVSAQVTLSLILLIGAGLFIRSLSNLEAQNPGFRTRGLIQFNLNPNNAGLDTDRTAFFYQRLTDRLHATPGVTNTGTADLAILRENEWDSSITIEGYHAAQGEDIDPHFNSVDPGYFDTMGIRVRSGRGFSTKDDTVAPKVAVVNASFAKRYFGATSPIGHRIGMGSDPGTKTDIEIIGVVNDTRYESLRADIPQEVYIAEHQNPAYGRVVYVQTDRDTAGIMGAIRAAVHDIDAGVPVITMKTFEGQIKESLVTERLIATLSTIFGVLATMLVLIGLYGVMSFMVTRRSREIGIRMALGAMAGDVVWLVMREGLILIGAGIIIGLPLTFALSRLIKSQLYGILPGDPQSIALATLLLAAVTAAAGYIPARRAAASDPLHILRYE
jgi:predicted permease